MQTGLVAEERVGLGASWRLHHQVRRGLLMTPPSAHTAPPRSETPRSALCRQGAWRRRLGPFTTVPALCGRPLHADVSGRRGFQRCSCG